MITTLNETLDKLFIPFAKDDTGLTIETNGLRAKIDTLDPKMKIYSISVSKNGINIEIEKVSYWQKLWIAIMDFQLQKHG